MSETREQLHAVAVPVVGVEAPVPGEGVLLGAVHDEPQPLQPYGGRVEVLDALQEEGRMCLAGGREAGLDTDVQLDTADTVVAGLRNQQPPWAASAEGLATSGRPRPSP